MVPIDPIVVFIASLQFIGWDFPSYVYTDIILDSIIVKFQFFMFFMKRATNRIDGIYCSIISALSMKSHLGVLNDSLVGFL